MEYWFHLIWDYVVNPKFRFAKKKGSFKLLKQIFENHYQHLSEAGTFST